MTNQDTIQVLKGLEAVRLRPGMYIGGTDKKALHHILWEVFDNCVDEHMAKDPKGNPYCNLIQVIIGDDGETVTITDNGRGIPVTVHSEYQEEGITQLELALTKLHAGGKFTHDTATGGLHGVGVSCVNAVSDRMEVIVNRDGGCFIQTYSRGIPTSKLDRIGNSNNHGTGITFHPDPEIFTETIKYDEEIIITFGKGEMSTEQDVERVSFDSSLSRFLHLTNLPLRRHPAFVRDEPSPLLHDDPRQSSSSASRASRGVVCFVRRFKRG